MGPKMEGTVGFLSFLYIYCLYQLGGPVLKTLLDCNVVGIALAMRVYPGRYDA